MKRIMLVLFTCSAILSGTLCSQQYEKFQQINKIYIKYLNRDIVTQFDIHCSYFDTASANRYESVMIDDPKQIKLITKCLSKSRADSEVNGIDARAKIYMYNSQKIELVYCIDGLKTLAKNDEQYFVNSCIADLVYDIIEKVSKKK